VRSAANVKNDSGLVALIWLQQLGREAALPLRREPTSGQLRSGYS